MLLILIQVSHKTLFTIFQDKFMFYLNDLWIQNTSQAKIIVLSFVLIDEMRIAIRGQNCISFLKYVLEKQMNKINIGKYVMHFSRNIWRQESWYDVESKFKNIFLYLFSTILFINLTWWLIELSFYLKNSVAKWSMYIVEYITIRWK